MMSPWANGRSSGTRRPKTADESNIDDNEAEIRVSDRRVSHPDMALSGMVKGDRRAETIDIRDVNRPKKAKNVR